MKSYLKHLVIAVVVANFCIKKYSERGVTMRIPELIWIMENRGNIDKEDYEALESFNVFNQYDNERQLEQNATRMLELVSLVRHIHKKYNE